MPKKTIWLKSMASKIFLDSNIVLDFLDNKRLHHKQAVSLFLEIESGLFEAYISETVISNTDYILRKQASRSQRVSLYNDLLRLLNLLPCSAPACEAAFRVEFADIEDCILYQIAAEAHLDYFITNDLKLLKHFSLKKPAAITPGRLLGKKPSK